MYRLKLKHHFSAAHQLTHAYSKECNDSIHGHNWKVQIEVNTYDLINGMVIDFKKLKEIVNQLDHKLLNDIVDFEPTAENLAKYLHDEIQKEFKHDNETSKSIKRIAIIKITIWEADGASITYEI